MTGPATTPHRRRAETAAIQLRRLLHLIPELADGEEHCVEEVARRAGTSPRALLADLNALVERYDVPAGWVDAMTIFVDDAHVTVHSNHFLRPMRLTMAELCALELGLMLVERERPAGDRPAVASALARLREAITNLPANDHMANLRVAEMADAGTSIVLGTVRSALRDGRKLRLRYRAGAAEAATERVVCPYATAFANGSWYAIANCERSEGLRFFRLDRIESADPLDEHFERPAAFSLEAVLPHGRAFSAQHAGAMTVWYSPRIARWIAEREGCMPADDGSLTLEHPLADEEWAIRHVLQYGPDAEVLHPPELRALLARRLAEMAADQCGTYP